MPSVTYRVRISGIGFRYPWYGQAVNACIKHGISISRIKRLEEETVLEYEERTGHCYGCAPCSRRREGECEGAKPGAFYYPHDCPNFFNREEERAKKEAGWW